MATALASAPQSPTDFYQFCLEALNEAGSRFLVGGGYAYAQYTGIGRPLKDLDLFVRQADFQGVLATLDRAGFRTEVTFPHWLGKAFCGDEFVDVIHSSGNGVVVVDDGWFEHAVHDRVLGVPVLLCPVEEMIWSKAFVMERERFDGADILHLIRTCGPGLDWKRLVARFGAHWRVLFSHLILFGYVYPSERRIVPQEILKDMSRKMQLEQAMRGSSGRVCNGTLLSRAQFLVDIGEWGYEDARDAPDVHMSREQIEQWTAAIQDEIGSHEVHPGGGGR